MRWIFFTLLLLNLLTFALGMVVTSQEVANVAGEGVTASAEGGRSSKGGGAPLVLLGELSESERADLGRKLTLAVGVSDGKGGGGESPAGKVGDDLGEGGRKLCEMLGAFPDRLSADDFVERLKAIEVASSVQELELPAGEGYWVYLPPENNRGEALRKLSELQSRGVDSYVIPKGELENGISLGMFSKKNLADARIEQLKSLGLEPKIESIERTYREFWVMLEHREEEKMSDLTWEKTLKDNKMLQRRQNYCFALASEQNIQ
ncbi:MAG: SPOR domain-containing protein [Alteromonadaceae bacterium]|nr:MAG: SPOR domain-containing protein [Alteromonadaceae bacterium]